MQYKTLFEKRRILESADQTHVPHALFKRTLETSSQANNTY